MLLNGIQICIMAYSPFTFLVTSKMMTNLWSMVRIIHRCYRELGVWFRVALETSKIAIFFRIGRKIEVTICGHNCGSIKVSDVVWFKEFCEKEDENDGFFISVKPEIPVSVNLLG